jgi:hypothetical protein
VNLAIVGIVLDDRIYRIPHPNTPLPVKLIRGLKTEKGDNNSGLLLASCGFYFNSNGKITFQSL